MLASVLAAGGAIDPKNLLETFGTIGLFAIIFAETGLLVGFFLPGDSLLVLAGLICAVGSKSDVHVKLDLPVILFGLAVAAVAGAQTGYIIGRKAGPSLFEREDSRFFKKKHVEKAQAYYDHHGVKTIIVARFIPIVRTFANPMAGVAKMDVRTFTMFNVVGGTVWTTSVVMLGFILGKTIPSAEDHLLIIEAVIIALSLTPLAYEVARHRRQAKVAAEQGTPVA